MESAMNKEKFIEAIKARKEEVAHYQVNIDNYSAMIALLPCAWPEELLSHRETDPSLFLDQWSFEKIQLLSDLQFREKLRRTLTTERLEQRKSMLVLQVLEQKLEKMA
jgi:hypothetical protein